MDPRERDQFVDELLDSALARYRSAEPRLGLEEGVLARLRSEQQPIPWLGWTWRLAAGVAGFAIVLATVHLARRTVHAPGPPTQAPVIGLPKAAQAAPTPQPGITAAVAQPHTPPPALSRTARPLAPRREEAEPRHDVFPSPAPLSEQERLLMSYVKLTPSPDSLTFHAGDREIEEIRIKPLELAPLETLSPQSENVTH